MQNKDDILKEIDTVKLQLDLMGVAADTATDESKDEWAQKQDALQKRLEELQDMFLSLGAQESSVEAEPVIVTPSTPVQDEPTLMGDADAMLDAILSADEPQAQEHDSATDKMADAMIECILNSDESPADNADELLQQILQEQDPAPADETMNVMADAMTENILSAQDRESNAAETAQPDFGDAEAEAMLNEILAASEPETELPPIDTDAIVEQIFAQPIRVDDVSEQPVYAQPAEEASAPIIMGEPFVMQAEETIPEEPVMQAEEVALPADSVLQAEEIADPAEPIMQPDEEEVVIAAEPAAPQTDEKPETSEKLTLNTVDPDIAGEILREIMAANERIAEMQQAQAELYERTDGGRNAPESGSVATGTTGDFDVANADAMLQVEMLKMEAQEVNRKAQAALLEAEKMKKEAEQIKLAAETERAMYAAEMELQRGLRNEEENMRAAAEQATKDKLAEKIARRKNEITAIRNGLQDVKDTDSAFLLREKLFSIQLVLDEEERNSPEIMYLLTKSMDDISHSLEVAELKRRVAALTAALKKPVRKAPAKKTAANKKAVAKKKAAKAKAKKAAAKKKAVAKRGRPPVRGVARPPARRRYMVRPSSSAPRAYR